MSRSGRKKETFEFTPPDIDRVAAYLDMMSTAGDGWINLTPGVVDEDEDTEESPGLFSAIFGGKQSPVTMATLMPPKPNRVPSDGVTVGLLHPAGSKVVARLASEGMPVPTGWVVRQDHPRRGLVVRAGADEKAEAVVTWALRVGAALCPKELTGRWQAVVFLP